MICMRSSRVADSVELLRNRTFRSIPESQFLLPVARSIKQVRDFIPPQKSSIRVLRTRVHPRVVNPPLPGGDTRGLHLVEP